MSTLVFLLMDLDLLPPETVMLMAATVLDATTGTCHSEKDAQSPSSSSARRDLREPPASRHMC